MARGVTDKYCEKCGEHFVGGGRAKWCPVCYPAAKKESVAAGKRRYSESNREAISCWQREYRDSNREKLREYSRSHYAKNREARLASASEYAKANRAKINAYQRKWKRERRAEDATLRIADSLSTLCRTALRRLGYRKNTKTATILGCSWDHLLAHLASLCYGGMTAEDILANDGRVHIDHVIPLATAKTEEDVVRLCHYTNLQPLWAADNLEKSDRLDWVHPRDRA